MVVYACPIFSASSALVSQRRATHGSGLSLSCRNYLLIRPHSFKVQRMSR